MAKVVMSVKEYLTLREAVEASESATRGPLAQFIAASGRKEDNPLLAEVAQLRTENEKLRVRQHETRPYASPGVLEVLQQVFRLLQFAVANLPPETVPGWPYEALRGFVETVRPVCDGNQTTKEMLDEFLSFAREAEAHEKRRGPRVPATVRGMPGIETEEARAAHEQLVVIPGKLPGNVT